MSVTTQSPVEQKPPTIRQVATLCIAVANCHQQAELCGADWTGYHVHPEHLGTPGVSYATSVPYLLYQLSKTEVSDNGLSIVTQNVPATPAVLAHTAITVGVSGDNGDHSAYWRIVERLSKITGCAVPTNGTDHTICIPRLRVVDMETFEEWFTQVVSCAGFVPGEDFCVAADGAEE